MINVFCLFCLKDKFSSISSVILYIFTKTMRFSQHWVHNMSKQMKVEWKTFSFLYSDVVSNTIKYLRLLKTTFNFYRFCPKLHALDSYCGVEEDVEHLLADWKINQVLICYDDIYHVKGTPEDEKTHYFANPHRDSTTRCVSNSSVLYTTE